MNNNNDAKTAFSSAAETDADRARMRKLVLGSIAVFSGVFLIAIVASTFLPEREVPATALPTSEGLTLAPMMR